MRQTPYTPVACSLHDELQLLVMRQRLVRWSFTDDGGRTVTTEARATDILSRDGAEWVILDDGTAVRLDRLHDVDGRPFAGTC